ncbi:uncharacterized protein [Littorina saxatilis]|uniref:uncharacterized protein n=1 Tax=Littorina saxatilis TaxID=31220 RepID=UPI0038B5DAD5
MMKASSSHRSSTGSSDSKARRHPRGEHIVRNMDTGSMVVLGRSNYFRYNHPQEARKMKEAMNANQRISCVPLQFLHELDGNPDYDKMIAEAEHHRLSRGSADGSTGSPRDLQPLDSDDFVNKVAKFEMISRGKPTSPTAKSPTPISPTSTSSGAGAVRYSGLTSPSYMGEKVFSRDTATTRVSAAVLQGGGERVNSTCSSLSSSSLTSVSTLNCSSDSSGSNRSLTSPPITPHGSWQLHLTPSHPHPVPHTFSHPSGAQGPTFVTLGDRRYDNRGEAASVVIRPAADSAKQSHRGVVNGDAPSIVSTTTAPKYSSGGVPLRDSTSSKDTGSETGSDKSHRDTFEGMDFDVSQMSESEQELARRHREIVTERKRDQEQEKMERQRLEEILRMCAEYQQEADAPPSKTKGPHHQQGGQKATTPTSVATSSSSSVASLKLRRAAPPPGFLDLNRSTPEADQERRTSGDSSTSTTTKSLEASNGEKERKFSGEFRPNVTKIKTNGSLMLSSPSNPHKEGLSTFSMKRCESNSSTSEDEMLAGNSEDTGTIKRRPQPPTVPEEASSPSQVVSSAHISLDRNNVPSSASSAASSAGSNVPSKSGVLSGSKFVSVPVQHMSSSSSSSSTAYKAGGVNSPDHNHSNAYTSPTTKDAAPFSPKDASFSPTSVGQSRIDEILNSSFEADREAAEMSSYGKFSVHINAQISNDEGLVMDDDREMSRRSKLSHSSSTSSSKDSQSSVSSGQTVMENYVDGVDGKEDTPTPVNSDSEGETFRAGSNCVSLSNGVDTPTAPLSPEMLRSHEVSCCVNFCIDLWRFLWLVFDG